MSTTAYHLPFQVLKKPSIVQTNVKQRVDENVSENRDTYAVTDDRWKTNSPYQIGIWDIDLHTNELEVYCG